MEIPMKSITQLLLLIVLAGAPGLLAQNCANNAPALTSPPPRAAYNINTVRSGLQQPTTKGLTRGPMLLISAHRGYWKDAPENSIRAFFEAVRAGVEIVEIDVRVTSDGIPVMAHDDDIARTTTGGGLVESNTFAQYQTYFLRDRHGCPTSIPNANNIVTGETGTGFIQVLKAFVDNGLIYKDASGTLRGTTIIVDIKGARADKAQNFKTILAAYTALINAGAPYNVLAGAVDFKTPLNTLPDPAVLKQLPYSWNATTNNFGIIPVIFPEDANHQNTVAGLLNGADANFNAYQKEAFTLHFETNQLYNGDSDQAYRDYLAQGASQTGANPPKYSYAIAGYAPDNFFPEGEPTGGRCCKEPETLPWAVGQHPDTVGTYANGLYTPSPNALAWPQYPLVAGKSGNAPLCIVGKGAINPATGSAYPNRGCLDYRGRWDFLMSTGMTVFTVERVTDAISLASLLTLRDTNYLSQ
jgi:hypothetical protein